MALLCGLLTVHARVLCTQYCRSPKCHCFGRDSGTLTATGCKCVLTIMLANLLHVPGLKTPCFRSLRAR
jgi:hypothetical protein